MVDFEDFSLPKFVQGFYVMSETLGHFTNDEIQIV
jgi:hypothetical protein